MTFRSVALRPAVAVAIAISVTVLEAQNATVTVAVDAAANRRAINAAVYGVAFATPEQLKSLNAPLHRYGGNSSSRYNWQLNADNRGFDWYFQSLADPSPTPGRRADDFVLDSWSAGASPMITVPMIDYIAKVGANRGTLASFDSRIYGAQDDCDWQWFPQACNGMKDGHPIVGNNPLDANVANSPALQASWIAHLVQRFGNAAAGGVRYYILDNEHSIWHSTHRDVSPAGLTMARARDTMLAYSAAIKNVDPGALVVGPEEWGWSGYFYSGADQQHGDEHGWTYLPDRAAHGGMDYLPWLLRELKTQSDIDGRRALDLCSIHYYPQGGEFWPGSVTTAMQLRRNRSTRSLWDPNYRDETWINAKVQLIPRLRSWVNTYYYPGTPIGITEYNWGAEHHINGATTQADIYGIFGREGLDFAARWTTPETNTPTFKAMQVYRNYDGNGSTFGDTSVRATSSANPDNLSVFAAERASDGALTIMVISKVLAGTTPLSLSLANFEAGTTAEVWQLTAANAITRRADIAVSGQGFATSVPAQSVTLFVVPPAGVSSNDVPVADAKATPTAATPGTAIAFDASASSDGDGYIVSYQWTFGDGGSAAGSTARHAYQAPGTYAVNLVVTDDDGATHSDSLSITINQNTSSTLPAAPSNLTVSAIGRTVTLTWHDTAWNETGFHVERAAQGKRRFSRIATVGANVVTVSKSQAAATWVYRVRAYNAAGKSAYSSNVTIQVK
jgi:chitodextrinase